MPGRKNSFTVTQVNSIAEVEKMDGMTKKAAELFRKMDPEGRKTILSMLRSIQPEERGEKKNERSNQGIIRD